MYEAPTIIILGSVGELTQELTVGDKLDAAFPEGTPGEDLTFS